MRKYGSSSIQTTFREFGSAFCFSFIIRTGDLLLSSLGKGRKFTISENWPRSILYRAVNCQEKSWKVRETFSINHFLVVFFFFNYGFAFVTFVYYRRCELSANVTEACRENHTRSTRRVLFRLRTRSIDVVSQNTHTQTYSLSKVTVFATFIRSNGRGESLRDAFIHDISVLLLLSSWLLWLSFYFVFPSTAP